MVTFVTLRDNVFLPYCKTLTRQAKSFFFFDKLELIVTHLDTEAVTEVWYCFLDNVVAVRAVPILAVESR